MSFSRRISGLACAAMLALIPLQGGRAQGGDPADLAFWQSISNSTNVEEYKAYLQAFPNGRFATVARLRIAPVGPARPLPTPAPGPAPVTDNNVADTDPDPSLTITPASGRVGQKFVIALLNFPEADNRDMIVVVPAGSPVMRPSANPDQTRIVWSGYAANAKLYNNTLRDVGPFAPGKYEARWMSVLYNNAHEYESKATVAFTVR